MQVLNNIWNWVLPIGSCLTIGSILVVIGTAILKGMLAKIASKINIDTFVDKVTETQEKAAEKAAERVKTVSFKQSIKPLVDSELKKVGEAAKEQIEGSVKEIKQSNAAVLEAIRALGAYFDDSLVSDEKKEAFRAALALAEEETVTEVETVAEISEPVVQPVKKKGGSAR